MTESKKQSAKFTYADIYKHEGDEWKPLCNKGWAELHLFYNYENESFSLLAWHVGTELVLLDIVLTKACSYKHSSKPNIHIFRDGRSTFAFGFHEDSLKQATEFSIAVSHVISNMLSKSPQKKTRAWSRHALDVFTLTQGKNETEQKIDSTAKTRHGYIQKETGRFKTYDIYWTPEIVEGFRFMEILYVEGSFATMLSKQFGVAPEALPSKRVPGYSSELPTLLLDLNQMIRDLSGYKTVGIFRLAPDGKRNDEVKKLIDRGGGEWKTTCRDENLCANLLKVWLREMPVPILDQIDPSIVKTSQDLGTVAKAMEEFPEPGRSILLYLWDMCVEIAALETVNKMNPHNLAVVIAPNLFDANKFENPMKAVNFSGSASMFFQKGIEWRQVSDHVQIL